MEANTAAFASHHATLASLHLQRPLIWAQASCSFRAAAGRMVPPPSLRRCASAATCGRVKRARCRCFGASTETHVAHCPVET
eukprot:573833-Pleurochrysis_carterae.AAC.3